MSQVTAETLFHRITSLPFRVAVWIFQLDLLTTGTRLNLIPKPEACFIHSRDEGRQIIYCEDNPVPSTRFLPASIGHRPQA